MGDIDNEMRRVMADGGNVPRALVISPNWIGDAVLSQSLLQLLRKHHPDRKIDVLAPAWVAPVWRQMAEVDEVIESPFRHGALQLRERWNLAQALRRRRYGEAYILPNTLKFALIPWLAGIPRRVGYKGESRYGVINVMHHDEPGAPRPMVAFYAALAEPPAVVVRPFADLPRPALAVSRQQSDQVLNLVGLHRDFPLIAFAPGAEFGPAKRWPAGHFGELANFISTAFPRSQIVLLGSAKDAPVGNEILKLAPQVHNLAGLTTLGQVTALIAAMDVVVSNDSGLLHITSALNRPIVALYGPTDPNHAPPFSDKSVSLFINLECSPCMQRECPLQHQRCMTGISAEMVWQAVRRLIQSSKISCSD